MELVRSIQPAHYYPEQHEVAVPHGIFPNEIVGAYPKRSDQYTGEFIPNPNYDGG